MSEGPPALNPAPALNRKRPLDVGPLRAFEAVARRLNFRAAAEELSLTQSAISRQIKSLEDELGAPLFLRGTRHVKLTGPGETLLRATLPALERLDGAVRQIRQARGRRVVNVSTFASFASLWLLPRLETFQRAHPDIDIRVTASDRLIALDDPDVDLALRYVSPQAVPEGAMHLFGETLTPVISPWLAAQVAAGQAPPLTRVADLARHTLLEEEDNRPSAEYLGWRRWLAQQDQAQLEPRRWLYLNFTHQQIQAALAGQGVALTRYGLVAEQIQRGELIEPFGPERRTHSPYGYWMVMLDHGRQREEVVRFAAWVSEQATSSSVDTTTPTPRKTKKASS